MNVQQMMKQAKSIQLKIQELQKVIEQKEIIGTAGGGAVTIITNGKNKVIKVKINKKIINIDEIEIIEDLVTVAFNNAKKNAEQYSQQEMNKLGLSPDMLQGMI